ncbi:MAG: phosphatase PAP2 family protein [Comamonas sp.]
MRLYPAIDRSAGWGLLAVCLLALALRWAQQRHDPRRAPVLAAAPGAGVSAAVAVVALGLFAALARQVVQPDPPAWLARLDGWMAAHPARLPEPLLARVADFTQLGDVTTLTGVAVLAGLALTWRRRWLALAWWTLAVAGNGLLVRWTKQVFGRERPDAPYLEVHGYSFPSGHAMSSLVVYGLLCLMLWGWSPGAGDSRRAARALALVLAVLIAAVGCSRIALQVHYASDVLAGWLLGLGWLALVGLLARPVRPVRAAAV